MTDGLITLVVDLIGGHVVRNCGTVNHIVVDKADRLGIDSRHGACDGRQEGKAIFCASSRVYVLEKEGFGIARVAGCKQTSFQISQVAAHANGHRRRLPVETRQAFEKRKI